MANNEETTTSFRVDISQLKAQFQEAQRSIRLVNSEFKNATAGMDDWSKTSDGLSAKIKQMNGVLDGEKAKLQSLKDQYAQVSAEQGESSNAAQELAIKINNQEAVVKNTEKELQKYVDRLNDLTTESVNTRNELEKLEDTIADQENQLKQLEREYQNAVITFGENSAEARNLQQSYNELSKSLEENQNSIVEVLTDEEKSKKAKEELKEKVENLTGSTKGLSDGYTVAKDVIASFIKDGIQWAIDKFKELMSAQDETMKSFQAQTGTATEDMSAYNGEMQELYKQGYGETLTDIADAMAQVKQTTGEVDSSKLSEMTKNAMLLSETYEFDVAESLRAVNMLTDQFGVTSQEAYNLIVQGCQKGLNKNDDLLDTINEYGVHYKQLGYSADEFLNSLLNGTDAGTFSVDKLGDAMKEFGIRVKDNSDSTISAFKDLGIVSDKATGSIGAHQKAINDLSPKLEKLEQDLKYAEMAQSEFNDKTSEMTKSKNAEKIAELNSKIASIKETIDFNTEAIKLWENSNYATMESSADLTTQFASGGDEAKKATEKVLTALFSMEDSVKQNEIGVALFGTMWEDLGAEGVKALTSVNGEIDKTNDSMSQIEELKLSDVNSQLEVLGRTAETEIIMPLINTFLPYVKQGISWLSENMESITTWVQSTLMPLIQIAIDWLQNNLLPVVQALFQWIIDNKDTIIATLVAIGTGFLAFNIVSIIQNVIAVFTALATVIQLVGVKQLVVNTIMNANPIGILCALIAGLIAYFVHLYNTSDEFRMMLEWLWEKIKEIVDKVKNKVKEIWDFFEGFGEYLYDWIHEDIPRFFSDCWQSIKDTFSDAKDWFFDTFDEAWQSVQDVFASWGEFFGGLWDNIKTTFSELGTKLGDSIGGTVKSAINGVIESIENTINGGVNLINGAIDLINAIPGVNIGYMDGLSLPRLAKGGIVSSPTLAQIGEQGREAIIPLENNLGWIKNLASQLAMQINQSTGFNNSTSSNVTNNFYQTNNSPKSLSRLEIYRQSKNLLSLKGA